VPAAYSLVGVFGEDGILRRHAVVPLRGGPE
jgi:hypothetical protein